jgi:hypothetical protein
MPLTSTPGYDRASADVIHPGDTASQSAGIPKLVELPVTGGS